MLLAFADGGPLRGAAPALPATGLKLQLESDSGVTNVAGAVTAWADVLSGSGVTLTQATGANQPEFNAAGFNGQPSITFTATKGLGTTSTSLVPSGTSDRTVVVIAKSTNTGTGATTGGALASFRSLATLWIVTLNNQPGGGVTYVYGTLTAALATLASQWSFTANPFLYEHYGTVSPTPGLTINIDRVARPLTGASNVIADNNAAPGFYLGNYYQMTGGFIGDIAAAWVWDHILTSPEIAAMRARALAKYGV